MHRFALPLIFISLFCPAAFAGNALTTFSISQEQGVTVYRGQPSAQNYQVIAAQQQSYEQRERRSNTEAKLIAQERLSAAQQREIAALKAQNSQQAAELAARNTRRPRIYSYYGRGFNPYYGRPYYRPYNGHPHKQK